MLGGAFRGLQTAVYNFTQGLGFSTKAIGEQAAAAEQASKMLRDYEDNLSAFNLKQAQYEAQIDKLLKQAKNKSISEKEANELIKEATRLQNLQIEDLKKNQREETAILVQKAKAAGATYQQILAIQKGATIESLNNVNDAADDELKALQENYTKRVQALGNLEEKREKINNASAVIDEKRKAKEEKAIADLQKKKEDALKAEEEAKKKKEIFDKDNEERAKELREKEKKQEQNDRERTKSLNESEREQRAQDLEDLKAIAEDERLTREQKLAEIKSIEDRRTNIEQGAADARKKIAEAEANAKIATLDAYSQILNSASEMAGRDTAAGKALAVASATISTYTAIAKTLAAFSGVPIPGYAIAQSIATGVAGLAAVKNILAVRVPGNNGGGGSGGGTPSLPPVIRPSSSFTRLGNEEPIRTTNEGGKVRVFVTESDITNAQEKVNSIKTKATIQ
jgi:chromosome segregation ATPase